MQNFRPDMRIELVRQNVVVSAFTLNSDLVKLTSKSSVYEFPTLQIESNDPELSNLLMGFEKEERLRLWWSHPNTTEDTFTLGCEVGFYKKNTRFDRKDGRDTLSINAEGIHSAFNLALCELPDAQDFCDCDFGTFVRMLFELADVRCDLKIDKFLEKKEITGLTRRTNVYRLFKEVCMFIGASVLFKPDNSVYIESVSQRYERLSSVEPTVIDENDIISMSKSESIEPRR